MQRTAFSLFIGLAIVAGLAHPARAQRGRHNGTVSTPYGTFNAREMAQAGGDPTAAFQFRQQKQLMQYQQLQLKQQQSLMQQQAKQADFLKKHPEAARALGTPAPTGATTKKADKKSARKKAPASANAAGSTETKQPS